LIDAGSETDANATKRGSSSFTSSLGMYGGFPKSKMAHTPLGVTLSVLSSRTKDGDLRRSRKFASSVVMEIELRSNGAHRPPVDRVTSPPKRASRNPLRATLVAAMAQGGLLSDVRLLRRHRCELVDHKGGYGRSMLATRFPLLRAGHSNSSQRLASPVLKRAQSNDKSAAQLSSSRQTSGLATTTASLSTAQVKPGRAVVVS
jgi:hypothetical protein